MLPFPLLAVLLLPPIAQAAAGADWPDIVERFGAFAIVALAAGLALRRVYGEKADLEISVRADVIPAIVRATEALDRLPRIVEHDADAHDRIERNLERTMAAVERIERKLDGR